jgi:hypothetical protein
MAAARTEDARTGIRDMEARGLHRVTVEDGLYPRAPVVDALLLALAADIRCLVLVVAGAPLPAAMVADLRAVVVDRLTAAALHTVVASATDTTKDIAGAS